MLDSTDRASSFYTNRFFFCTFSGSFVAFLENGLKRDDDDEVILRIKYTLGTRCIICLFMLYAELSIKKPITSIFQPIYTIELESLQKVLHFPEEVALLLSEAENNLFYQVPPIDYLRQVTLDLGGPLTLRTTVRTLVERFNEVSAYWRGFFFEFHGQHTNSREVVNHKSTWNETISKVRKYLIWKVLAFPMKGKFDFDFFQREWNFPFEVRSVLTI